MGLPDLGNFQNDLEDFTRKGACDVAFARTACCMTASPCLPDLPTTGQAGCQKELSKPPRSSCIRLHVLFQVAACQLEFFLYGYGSCIPPLTSACIKPNVLDGASLDG